MTNLRQFTSLLALAGMLAMPAVTLADTTAPYYGPGMGQQFSPEQRQQMWEYMRQQGYGPGMMMGPGMMGGWPSVTPEQRQQMWQYMHQQGYGPGMMMGPGMWQPMTPEQYKKWWDQTHAPAGK